MGIAIFLVSIVHKDHLGCANVGISIMLREGHANIIQSTTLMYVLL